MLNKNMLLVLVICCVFVMGAFSFIGTVEAAKWKKFDSGKYISEYPPAGYKKVVYYKAFTKGENKLYYESYFYPKNGSAKKLSYRITLTKKKDIITEKGKDFFSKKINIDSFETKWSVKKYYNFSLKNNIKVSATSPDKLAFEIQLFSENNSEYKIYGIELHKTYVIAFIYKDNEEYCTLDIYKENKKITYKEYNQKRKLTSKKIFEPPYTPKSIYKIKIKEIITRILGKDIDIEYIT